MVEECVARLRVGVLTFPKPKRYPTLKYGLLPYVMVKFLVRGKVHLVQNRTTTMYGFTTHGQRATACSMAGQGAGGGTGHWVIVRVEGAPPSLAHRTPSLT
eukprot:scaffold58467_cov61-Phaeocystis_antarctica.AAC.1